MFKTGEGILLLALLLLVSLLALATAPLLAESLLSTSAPAPLETFSSSRPLVGAYLYYWYDQPSGEHFRNEDGSDALTNHPAVSEGYSYKREDWWRRQFTDMREAGLDFALPVFWGNPADKQKAGNLKWSYDGLPPMVEAARAMRKAGIPPPKIGMFYDTSTLQCNVDGHRVDLTTDDGRAWFYSTIRDFFSMVPADLWAMVDSKPIIFLYTSNFASHGADDKSLLPYVKRHFAQDFGGVTPYIVADRTWDINADAVYAWGAAFHPNVHDVACVGPGFDNHAAPSSKGEKRDRENGTFYEQSWKSMLRLDPALRPKIATVETWNELHEGTEIAPSREYGRAYVDLTRKYAGLWRTGTRLGPDDLLGHATFVWINFGRHAIGNGLEPVKWEDGLVEQTQRGGAACFQTVRNRFNGSQYAYFSIDDGFCFGPSGDFDVSIEYLDEGGGYFTLQYDSTDQKAVLSGAYKESKRVTFSNTGLWRTSHFLNTDARFTDQQNDGADFRFAVTGNSLRMHRVEVSRHAK